MEGLSLNRPSLCLQPDEQNCHARWLQCECHCRGGAAKRCAFPLFFGYACLMIPSHNFLCFYLAPQGRSKENCVVRCNTTNQFAYTLMPFSANIRLHGPQTWGVAGVAIQPDDSPSSMLLIVHCNRPSHKSRLGQALVSWGAVDQEIAYPLCKQLCCPAQSRFILTGFADVYTSKCVGHESSTCLVLKVNFRPQ